MVEGAKSQRAKNGCEDWWNKQSRWQDAQEEGLDLSEYNDKTYSDVEDAYGEFARAPKTLNYADMVDSHRSEEELRRVGIACLGHGKRHEARGEVYIKKGHQPAI